MTIYWGRVIGGGLLLELILFAVLLPISAMNRTLFLAAVPVGAFVFGYVVCWWVFRKARGAIWVNAALLGLLATVIYLGIVVASAGIGAAIATYGLPLFVFSNAMRIAGCLSAAFKLQRGAVTSGSTVQSRHVYAAPAYHSGVASANVRARLRAGARDRAPATRTSRFECCIPAEVTGSRRFPTRLAPR